MTQFAMSPDGVRIALHDLGDPDGAPVVLIHGFSSNARRNWIATGWGEALAAEGLRGIAIDLRGHGESDRPSVGYEVPHFLDDVDALLEGLALDEPPGAIGYSMGARLLWRHAGTRPDAFRALVLGGLPAGDPFDGFDPERARRILAGDEPSTGAEGFVVDLAAAVPEHDPETLIQLAGEVSHTLFDPDEAPPQMPTLLMTGDRDTRADDTAELLPLLPSGRFAAIPGRSHNNAPTSGVFRREATRFLAEQLGVARAGPGVRRADARRDLARPQTCAGPVESSRPAPVPCTKRGSGPSLPLTATALRSTCHDRRARRTRAAPDLPGNRLRHRALRCGRGSGRWRAR